MNARQIIHWLTEQGWQESRRKGSHFQFKHKDCRFLITVPFHKGDIKRGTLSNIRRTASTMQTSNSLRN